MPLANSFRVPGRVTMMMAMPLSLLLVWMFGNSGNKLRFFKLPIGSWVSFFAFSALLIFNFYLFDKVPEPTYYIPARILNLPTWTEDAVFKLGLAVLFLAGAKSTIQAFYSDRSAKLLSVANLLAGALLIASVLAQTGIALRYGTWVAKSRPTVTFDSFESRKKRSVDFFGNAGFGMELPSVTKQIKESALDPLLARFFTKIITADSNESAYKILASSRKPDEAVVETSSELAPSPGFKSIVLTNNTFNRLVFKTEGNGAGILTVNYPYLPGFHAAVDNKETKVLRTNGYQVGIFVPAKSKKVILNYKSSAATMGIIITIISFISLLSYIAFSVLKKQSYRFISLSVLCAGGILLFFLFNDMINGGENIQTEYKWTTSYMANVSNLAYGKKTRASSIFLGQMPYYYYPGRAVDGEHSGRGWIAHRRDRNPFWQVDLNRIRAIKSIVITGLSGPVAVSGRPLHIQVSNTGKRFKTVLIKKDRTGYRGKSWKIDLKDISGRFVRLWARGLGRFALKEVEIFSDIDS
jgi:hypothetical protein